MDSDFPTNSLPRYTKYSGQACGLDALDCKRTVYGPTNLSPTPYSSQVTRHAIRAYTQVLGHLPALHVVHVCLDELHSLLLDADARTPAAAAEIVAL